MKQAFCVFLFFASLVLPSSLFGTTVPLGTISGSLGVQVEVPLPYANHSVTVSVINTDTSEVAASFTWMNQYAWNTSFADGVSGSVGYADYNYLDVSVSGLPEGNYEIVTGGTTDGWMGSQDISEELQVYYY